MKGQKLKKKFLSWLDIEAQEIAKLTALFIAGTVVVRPEGSEYGDLSHLPEDREINVQDQMRASRLDTLARAFAKEAIEVGRKVLLKRKYNDLKFHPRYKREIAELKRQP